MSMGAAPEVIANPVRLSCLGITKSFGGLRALNDVSLDFSGGQLVALVGPNGAGKSTLIDALTGFVKPDAGVVKFASGPLRGAPWRRARKGRMRRTFQHPKPAQNLTVDENVVVGALGARCGTARGIAQALVRPRWGSLSRRCDAISDAAVAELDIDTGVAAAAMSVGDMRLLEFARALSGEPEIVFVDEPFAGADAAGMERMGVELRRLADAGCAVVVVDHHVDVLADLADRMILMFQGAVIFDGEPHAGLRSPEMRRVYFGDSDV